MASGFPLRVNGVQILSSEALYQACRFPHLPDVQEKIINEKSPMSAKMVGKPFRKNSRPDWADTRIKIMRWCLRVKLAQNFVEFGKLLESTFDKLIVEDSSKDNFWGAIRDKNDENVLKGVNALGCLLMELRQFYNEKRYSYEIFVVEPLNISDFRLCGKPIETIDERENFISFIKRSTRYFEIENLKEYKPFDIGTYKKEEQMAGMVQEPDTNKKKETPIEKEVKSSKANIEKKTNSKKKKIGLYEGQTTLPS